MRQREKLFGYGRPCPLDRNAKARIMHWARCLLQILVSRWELPPGSIPAQLGHGLGEAENFLDKKAPTRGGQRGAAPRPRSSPRL
jgi:hypothetical protein